MRCSECNYYAFSEDSEFEHCCFREWGHDDYEIAPCDDPDFDEPEPFNL